MLRKPATYSPMLLIPLHFPCAGGTAAGAAALPSCDSDQGPCAPDLADPAQACRSCQAHWQLPSPSVHAAAVAWQGTCRLHARSPSVPLLNVNLDSQCTAQSLALCRICSMGRVLHPHQMQRPFADWPAKPARCLLLAWHP